ncbi:MAG: MarR family transcriptional regulator [Caulobacteraceae bacterium]|nr:MarR family transcriptional regulator [Caulobacteraceae bacterium]
MTSMLVRLARIYRSGIDDALTGLGLSDALALPVVVLGRRPEGMRQNQLADDLGVEGPSLVRLLDRLVEDGLVERREDPADRRAKTVHLTAVGQDHSRKASRVLDAFRASLLEGVPPEDIEATLRVFEVMQARLLAARREGRP